ncbi:MAG: 5-(carboxyamino)imidazole ribonucleotide synthase [Myxococcota bacterium]
MTMRVGILGGGQLGQMLAKAAKTLGVETLVLDPTPDAVAGQVTTHLAADWNDAEALDALAACDVVTYEFENVPRETVEALVSRVPVHPAPEALVLSGDRLLEKRFFQSLGIEPAPFAPVSSREELDAAVAEIGLPGVLKTRRFGYDGKGQAVLRNAADVTAAWDTLGGEDLVLEGFVPFDREISIGAARGRDGSMRYWPATENVHVDGILHLSTAPAENVDEALFEKASAGLEAIMAKLDYVGVLVVEFFQLGDRLVANEMACRVHNSTHWTIEGAPASQFENQIRAVAGMPLGETEAEGFSAMLNLVGTIPDLASLQGVPGVFVHDYGKAPRPGRKLGHITVTAATRDELATLLARVIEVAGDCSRC